jgi:hypothetical protein
MAEEKKPKDRSPSFPYIGLSKAFERTERLYNYAKRFETRIADAAKPAWNMGAKSSSTQQTVGALLAYGLIEDSGSGEGRKIKISDLAYRALVDQRPGAKEAALAEAAVKPKLLEEYIGKWADERPPEATALSELTFDRGFTPDGAKAFLRVFEDTVRYAKPTDSDKLVDTESDKGDAGEPSNQPPAVGDFVRVEAGGQIILEKVKVRALQEHDGQVWVFVEGTEAGQKMEQVTVVEKAPEQVTPPVLPLQTRNEDQADAGDEMDRFTVDEGVVKITFPSGMTAASVEELEQFFNLFIKKAKRRAGAEKKPN